MIDLDKNIRYVVAFSGGADSALLAFLMQQEGYDIRLVHVIHPDSAASNSGEQLANFCPLWAEKYSLNISCLRVEPSLETLKSKGTEAAEREVRYNALFSSLFLDEALVTGHHLDDSIETFFFRLARGTSVKGLSGISPGSNQSRLFRPLLSLSKKKILQLVESAAILYGHDSTNDDTKLSRSFIRNKIIPLFVEHFSAEKFYPSMGRAMENMAECAELMEDLYNIDIQSCATNATEIDRGIFCKLSVARQQNLLYHFMSKNFGLFLTKSAINEIQKRLNSKKTIDQFTVSGIRFTIDKWMLRCQIP